MRTYAYLFVSLLVFSGIASAQRFLSIGIKGGVPFTDAFSDTTTMGVDVVTRAFSDSKNYVIGPTLELNLPFGLSIEADALYHPLSLSVLNTVIPMPPARSSTDISSWEFPILGKYRFLHLPLIKPYAEAGPSFRHVASQATYLSNAGLTLGVGVEVKLLAIKVGPEIRFTRWAGDGSRTGFIPAPSNLNQAQFLVGISF